MHYNRERIYHFTCEKCEMWWSIGVENMNMERISWICTWCGHKHLPPHYEEQDGVAHIDNTEVIV